MTVSEKIRTIDDKIEQNKAQYFLDRQIFRLIFRLHHQKMLVNMNFKQVKMFYQKKRLLEKATTTIRFEYSPLVSELKRQTDIAKDHYKVFKDQINVINNNNRKDDIKGEDDEIDDIDYIHIDDE